MFATSVALVGRSSHTRLQICTSKCFDQSAEKHWISEFWPHVTGFLAETLPESNYRPFMERGGTGSRWTAASGKSVQS